MTSMITPANRNAAVIIDNLQRDHEFVIIASVKHIYIAPCVASESEAQKTHGRALKRMDANLAHGCAR